MSAWSRDEALANLGLNEVIFETEKHGATDGIWILDRTIAVRNDRPQLQLFLVAHEMAHALSDRGTFTDGLGAEVLCNHAAMLVCEELGVPEEAAIAHVAMDSAREMTCWKKYMPTGEEIASVAAAILNAGWLGADLNGHDAG